MTRTARRRWSRELQMQVDGIALGDRGPVLVHGYDQPAGDKWMDDVIPGKLGAFDRATGEQLWLSPCEVGYGRGFGAGLGPEDDILVFGPSQHGHRAVRVSLASGELLAAREIEAFDDARVGEDLCVMVTRKRVRALFSRGLGEAWTYGREGERYHISARYGERVLVVYTNELLGSQGILCLDASTGEPQGNLLLPSQKVIHGMIADAGCVVALVSELEQALDPDLLGSGKRRAPDALAPATEGPGLIALACASRTDLRADLEPLWWSGAPESEDQDGLSDMVIGADSGKLYIARGALLEVRDLLSGRRLGELTLPGLDEHVAWHVAQGACLLAEETRISVFEIPD